MQCLFGFGKLQCSRSLEEGFEVWQTIALEQGYAFCWSWENLPKLGKLASLWKNFTPWVLSGDSSAEGFGSHSGSEVLWPRRTLCGHKEGPRLCRATAKVCRLLTCPRWWAAREQYGGWAKWQWFFCHLRLQGRRCCGQRGSNGLEPAVGWGRGRRARCRNWVQKRGAVCLGTVPGIAVMCQGWWEWGHWRRDDKNWQCVRFWLPTWEVETTGANRANEQQEEIGCLNQKAWEPGTGRQLI